MQFYRPYLRSTLHPAQVETATDDAVSYANASADECGAIAINERLGFGRRGHDLDVVKKDVVKNVVAWGCFRSRWGLVLANTYVGIRSSCDI